MKKLRMALIGAGQIAKVTHIPNYLSMEEVELVGICDNNPEAAKALAQQFGIPQYFGNHIEMLEKVKADAVTICVPNKFHCPITIDVLQRGCHVLCEKPPAMTAKEAIQMEETAKKEKKLLSYGFHLRHSKEVSILKRKIEDGALGSIYGARVQWLRRRGIPGWGNFINKEMQGGGPLIDIGAHMLDIALYLMDYPSIAYVCANANQSLGKKAKAGLMGNWSQERFTVEDSLFGFIKFKEKGSLSLETSFALNMKERDFKNVQLFGDQLGATAFPLELFGEEEGEIADYTYPFIKEQDWHYDCSYNFVKACQEKASLLITAEQGSYIQQVIAAFYESAESNMPVMM